MTVRPPGGWLSRRAPASRKTGATPSSTVMNRPRSLRIHASTRPSADAEHPHPPAWGCSHRPDHTREPACTLGGRRGATSLRIAAHRVTPSPAQKWRVRPTGEIISDASTERFIKFDELLGLVVGRIVRAGALRNPASMWFRGVDQRSAAIADGVEPAGRVSTLVGHDDSLAPRSPITRSRVAARRSSPGTVRPRSRRSRTPLGRRCTSSSAVGRRSRHRA
jgi:hypothetical protein